MALQKSNECPVFKCALFRRKRDEQWERYGKQVQTIVQGLSVTSLTVRDIQDSTLLADFPKDTVRSIDVIRRERVLRINPIASNTPILALQFSLDSVMSAFILELNSKNFAAMHEVTPTLAEPTFDMPDLRSSSVQDLILNLLFDARFEEFVSDLSTIIDEFKGVLNEGEGDEEQLLEMEEEDEDEDEDGGPYDEFGE
jgi:hypothetical protein